jgi:hypothetical protein
MKRIACFLAVLGLLTFASAASGQATGAREIARAQRSAVNACNTTFRLYGCVPVLARASLVTVRPHRLVFIQDLYGGFPDGATWHAFRAYQRIQHPYRPGRWITRAGRWMCLYSDLPNDGPRPCFGGYGGGDLPSEYGGGTL